VEVTIKINFTWEWRMVLTLLGGQFSGDFIITCEEERVEEILGMKCVTEVEFPMVNHKHVINKERKRRKGPSIAV